MSVFIGADGGGTKLQLRLEKDGYIIDSRLNAGVNPNDTGFERSADTVAAEMSYLCAANGIDRSEVSGIFAGIAGGSTADYASLLKDKLDKAFPNSSNGVSHDGENIIYAAFPEKDGAIVICGTGSSCFVKKGDDIHRIGGYSTFDMNGSGYEIGLRAICHTLKSYDGREERSYLCGLVEEKAGGSCIDKLKELLALSKKSIADYTKPVFDAAVKGDPYADAIIESSAEYIAESIRAAKRFFDERFEVCIAGSVGCHGYMLEKIRRLSSGISDVFPLEEKPVSGALYKAKLLSKK